MSIDQHLTIYMKRIMNSIITTGRAEFALMTSDGELLIDARLVLDNGEVIYERIDDESKIEIIDQMYKTVNSRLAFHQAEMFNEAEGEVLYS